MLKQLHVNLEVYFLLLYNEYNRTVSVEKGTSQFLKIKYHTFVLKIILQRID